MKVLILLTFLALAAAGIVDHDHQATSYQNIHIEHFHPVPTYIKKEHKHLLEHPIPLGSSVSNLQVHHGGKHDYGFALHDATSEVQGHAFQDLGADDGGHEAYALQDQGEAYGQYQEHLGQAQEVDHYGYGNEETSSHLQYDTHEA